MFIRLVLHLAAPGVSNAAAIYDLQQRSRLHLHYLCVDLSEGVSQLSNQPHCSSQPPPQSTGSERKLKLMRIIELALQLSSMSGSAEGRILLFPSLAEGITLSIVSLLAEKYEKALK